ncbi:MAG: hypothetical protein ACRCXK_04090 [Wohlfahrtiimonas sp.]
MVKAVKEGTKISDRVNWSIHRNQLIQEIHTVFPIDGKPLKQDIPAHFLEEDTEERELLEELLGDLTWDQVANDVSIIYLINVDSIFLSTEAVYYFLPAYLVLMLIYLDINEQHVHKMMDSDVTTLNLLFMHNDNLNNIWGLFTDKQKEVFLKFLSLILDCPTYSIHERYKVCIMDFLDKNKLTLFNKEIYER